MGTQGSWPLRAFLLLMPVLILLSFPSCGQDTTLPSHLLGTWTTDDPRFSGRYLKLTETSLTFGQGEGNKSVHSIWQVKVREKSPDMICTLQYIDDQGEKMSLVLVYRPDESARISVGDRPQVWKKEATGEDR